MLLLLKVLLQILTVTAAALTGILDYKWHDKRTTRFKNSRNLLYLLTGSLLLLSIGVTIFDDIESNRKEKRLAADLKKVQDQNDGLQKGIAALTDKSVDLLNEQRNSFVSVLEDQRRIGLETTGSIRSASDLLQSSIRQTIFQQKRTLDSVTGGEGFCYLRLMVGNDAAQIVVVPQGTTPLYGVHFRLWEPSRYDGVQPDKFKELMKQDYIRVLGDLSTHGVIILEPLIPLGDSTSKEFVVEIGARNGFVNEQIRLVKINGAWKMAYKVTKQVGAKTRTLVQEIDPALAGSFKW